MYKLSVCLSSYLATASVFVQQKHPVVYVAIIPCDMGSQGEGIGGLGEKDRGWQLETETAREGEIDRQKKKARLRLSFLLAEKTLVSDSS